MKALVLSSGGLDSSVCLALAIEKYGKDQVMSLAIDYGQKHQKELEASRKIAAYYGISHQELNLISLFEDSNCTLLKGRADIEHSDYATQLEKSEGKPVSTYVPFRNGLFLSAAASIALANDCICLYYGAHSDDATGNAYPDTSIIFNEAITKAIYEGSGKQLEVVAPFIHLNKADVVRVGAHLKVPFNLTWSCYEGGKEPCGMCATCIDRKKAFERNGLIDPLIGGNK